MKNYVANIVKQNPATHRDGTSARRPFQTFIPGVARAPGRSSRSTRPLVRRAICSVRGMLLAILAIGLIGGLNLIPAGRVTAQTFTTLYSFSANGTNSSGAFTNRDGANPYARLTVAANGNIRYGTASLGGSSGAGTVFAVNLDGTGFTNLYSFTAGSTNASGDYTNSDGIGPWAGLILAGNTLYGTAYHGGRFGEGTVFAINTDGTGFTNLHSFSATGAFEINQDGTYPNAELILFGDTLYGTASRGGSAGLGAVFSVKRDGTRFAILHSFTGGADGAIPVAGLLVSGNILYGTATGSGAGSNGTVFAINADGTGFSIVHAFQPTRQTSNPPVCFHDLDCLPGYQCNGGGVCGCHGFCGGIGWDTGGTPVAMNFEGANPNAGLILAGGFLYGTAAACGSSGFGTVFAVNTNGAGFTVIHSFTGGADGANPWAGLVLSGDTLFSTTYSGASGSAGTVFAVNTDGSGFTNLHGFTGGSDGARPIGGLILTNNTLYGTTDLGGSSGNGTVFTLSFTPQLTILRSGENLVLSWPTNYEGFDYAGYELESTTNLGSSANWTTNSPAPVVLNGQNAVTNPISRAQQFYRLSQ